MKKLSPALIGALIACIVILIAALLLLVRYNQKQGNNGTISGQQNIPTTLVISRNVPAFASSGTASDANDNSFDTLWWSSTTNAWLAYDLSSVPLSERGRVLVVWYNESFDFDNTIANQYSYNVPQDYTIDSNPAPGGGHPPTSGWITHVTVRGNHYHSRQHVIDMAGNNWIRINVTAVDGAAENYNVRLNMDIYDANSALKDDWIFFGDSITAGAMGHLTINGIPAFAQLIYDKAPNYYPVQEDGGIGYLTSTDGAKYINTWLGIFPGKYVALSYGTNDALGCTNPASFYSNYVRMIRAILHAGKIPVIPLIPWGRMPNIQNCGPAINAEIDSLYKAFPQIIRGPNLWAYFQSHQNLISGDNIHPNEAGFAAYRQQWADAMLAEVFARQ